MADRTLQSETLYRRKPSGRYYPAAERIPEEPMSWPPGDYLVHVEPNRCNRHPVNPSQAEVAAAATVHEDAVARAVLARMAEGSYSPMDLAQAASEAQVAACDAADPARGEGGR